MSKDHSDMSIGLSIDKHYCTKLKALNFFEKAENITIYSKLLKIAFCTFQIRVSVNISREHDNNYLTFYLHGENDRFVLYEYIILIQANIQKSTL